MNEVTDYLDKKKVGYKVEGKEVVVTCGNCGKPKLYINKDSLVYHCFRCEAEEPENEWARGHFSKLKELWGHTVPIERVVREKNADANFTLETERYAHNLTKEKRALKYLYSRGFTDETIEKYKLGFVTWKGHDWISIPIYEDGIPKLIKYRQLPPEDKKMEKYRREAGGKTLLLNGECIDEFNEIIICEGELDALTLLQQGYNNVVGITGGAGTLKSEWYDKLIMKEKLYLIFDNDIVGQKAARDVWAARIGRGKCFNVLLPEGVDCNKFFLEKTKAHFDALMKKADIFQLDGILSLDDAFLKMYERSVDEESEQQLALPWKNVNRLLHGGFARKRLVVVGGIAGVGKTSWGLQICYHFAKNYNIPCLFFCLEMPEISLAAKIIQLDRNVVLEEIDFSDALIYADELGELPLYFGYAPSITPDQFYDTMRAVRDRYGVQFGVFDNLQRMVRSSEESDISIASAKFKDITMDLDIPFLLVSQPRKLNADRSPTMDDLKGSQSIPADADHVVLLHRKLVKGQDAEQYFQSEAIVTVAKSRFSPGGRTGLFFKGEISKFFENEQAVWDAGLEV